MNHRKDPVKAWFRRISLGKALFFLWRGERRKEREHVHCFRAVCRVLKPGDKV